MSLGTFITMLVLATTSAFTPGPNNAMVTASSVNFGFRRTLPHVMGIGIGFGIMILIVGLFLGQIFQTYSILREGLRWLGAALLAYVAYQIVSSGGIRKLGGAPRPMTFFEAAGFQWINPKGWAMAIALTSQFVTPDGPYFSGHLCRTWGSFRRHLGWLWHTAAATIEQSGAVAGLQLDDGYYDRRLYYLAIFLRFLFTGIFTGVF